MKEVTFEILVHPAGIPDLVKVEDLSSMRPEESDIREVAAWLVKNDIYCNLTHFGLVCTTTKDHFEAIFNTQLIKRENEEGLRRWDCTQEPHLPEELDKLINQISFPQSPDFYDPLRMI